MSGPGILYPYHNCSLIPLGPDRSQWILKKLMDHCQLLLFFIIFSLKELANVIITIVNPFCSPFLKGVLECKNNLIFRSWMMLPNQFKILILVWKYSNIMMLPNQFKILILVWNYFNINELFHHIVNNLVLTLFILLHKFKFS